jgi:5'-nucleotidase (lipoprotein e(P4) family)
MKHASTSVCMLALVLICDGCGPPRVRSAQPVTASADTTVPRRTHENLNAVLWMQTAVEYRASAEQAYRLARMQLEPALNDRAWTAAPEQTGDPSSLPPAVVLDLDETVLDNSAFQARQVQDGSSYTEAAWMRWCEERKAGAVPGSVEFLKDAAARGITAVFISNRDAAVEPATRETLIRLGVPLDDHRDTVLMRGERPEWESGDKSGRRRAVASAYRILLLIGDDLGDFVRGARGSLVERRTRAAMHESYWGRKWIMLPNPTYGSWEQAVTAGQDRPTDAQILAAKYQALDLQR